MGLFGQGIDMPGASNANKGFDWKNPNFLGGVGNVIGGAFGMNQGNPADAANKYFDQIPGQAGQYLNPYISQGQNAGNILSGQYGQMINDPSGILNRLGGGYQQSPGFQFNVDQATKAANKAAAAGGMLGSPAEQAELAKQVTGFANQDFNQYLQNALGLYGGGLSGFGHFQDQGYNASTNLAQMIANALAMQGQSNMQGRQQQQEQQGSGFGDILSGITGILGFL